MHNLVPSALQVLQELLVVAGGIAVVTTLTPFSHRSPLKPVLQTHENTPLVAAQYCVLIPTHSEHCSEAGLVVVATGAVVKVTSQRVPVNPILQLQV